MRMRIRVVGVLVAVGLGLVAEPARGQESEDARKRRSTAMIEQAAAAYDVAQFDEAIELLEKAWNIWPHPEILFNLCQAHRQRKDYDRAIFHCRGYLRKRPQSANREEIESLVAEMERTLAAQKATAEAPPEGMQVIPPEPAGSPEPATPSSDAAPAVAAPALPEVTDRRVPWYHDRLGWALAGAGVGLLAVAAATQVSAWSLHDDATEALDPSRAQELQERAAGRQTLALVAGGVGLAASAVGIVMLALPERRERGPAKAVSAPPRMNMRPLAWGFVLEGSF